MSQQFRLLRLAVNIRDQTFTSQMCAMPGTQKETKRFIVNLLASSCITGVYYSILVFNQPKRVLTRNATYF